MRGALRWATMFDLPSNARLLLTAAVVFIGACQSATVPDSAPSSDITPDSANKPASMPPSSPPVPPESVPPPGPLDATSPTTANQESMPTMEVQKRLSELGYKPGPIDGVM